MSPSVPLDFPQLLNPKLEIPSAKRETREQEPQERQHETTAAVLVDGVSPPFFFFFFFFFVPHSA